jgi:hypothetical protein
MFYQSKIEYGLIEAEPATSSAGPTLRQLEICAGSPSSINDSKLDYRLPVLPSGTLDGYSGLTTGTSSPVHRL